MPTSQKAPSASSFKSNSSVFGATRAKDTYLIAIDKALERLDKVGMANPETRFSALTDVHYLVNSWVSAYHRKDAAVDGRRYKAIMAMYEQVLAELGSVLGTSSLTGLSNKLREIFGLDVDAALMAHDRKADIKYFENKDRATARLRIEGGLIKRLMLDGPNGGKIVPLNSEVFADKITRPNSGAPLDGFAPFVLTHDWNFYMSKHVTAGEARSHNRDLDLEKGQAGFMQGIYHTSYVDGYSVAAAGTMRIDNGRLVGIRGDSGHYKPKDDKLVQALRALKAKGVKLNDVVLIHYFDRSKGVGAKEAIKSTKAGAPIAFGAKTLPPLPSAVPPPMASGAAANKYYGNYPSAPSKGSYGYPEPSGSSYPDPSYYITPVTNGGYIPLREMERIAAPSMRNLLSNPNTQAQMARYGETVTTAEQYLNSGGSNAVYVY